MAFDAFAYFKGSDVKGETQDKDMKAKGAFEIAHFDLGAENKINIGSVSAGGGAGKAAFKEINITKKTDSASCAMFSKLCDGTHFPDMVIELRRSGGAAGRSGVCFLKFEFKMVMIEDISWSGDEGEEVCEETVKLQYGAMKVTYTEQKDDGSTGSKHSGEWSRVLNQANLAVR